MEEEGEKVLLANEENAEDTKKEEVENENAEKKDNVNESLIQVENSEKEQKKGKFFSFFDRKKPNTADSEESKASTNNTEGFSFKKLFTRSEQPKTEVNNEEEKQNGNGIEQPTVDESQKSRRQLPIFSSFIGRFRRGKCKYIAYIIIMPTKL